ncbi:carboxypeptidase-like regulatory domain-containing protein [Arthrobacter sp. 92]|uniref:carboxypeptidase-like regulatory domain-containing protein n=1 Tax=Arthrobacter sp. 92 TaxID=3418175 RepID=UPI003D039766
MSVSEVKGFVWALLAALLWLCGCASSSRPVTGHSGVVTGLVLTAPVCPVERIGQECPPRPVSGAAVVALDGDAVRGSTLTDSTGAFHLRLPDGRYVIRASNVGGYASTATGPVVISDTPVHITLVVDSGIR